MVNTATDKQVTFMQRLIAERSGNVEAMKIRDNANQMWMLGVFGKREASACIEGLMALPRSAEGPSEERVAVTPAPTGMHVKDGVIYKVVLGRESGKPYAKRLVEDNIGHWKFVMAPGAVRELSEATRMSERDAAAFGRTHGVCVNCGAYLTDERSVFVGYGPVCAKNNGWAWGARPVVTPEGVADENAAEETLAFEEEAIEAEIVDPPLHQTPCVCGPYDRCRGVRARDAQASGNWRNRFRAYND